MDLEVYWEKYYQKKIEQKEQNLASLFQLNKPHLQGDKTIIYEVPSTLNKVEIEREFEYFLPYLREKLNHFNIQIKIVVKQSSERKFIYTNEEKYNRLVEINPLIDKLRNELDLEL